MAGRVGALPDAALSKDATMALDFSPQGYTPDGVAIFGNDAQLLVKFFKHPQISKFQTDQAGRPVYVDVVMVEVIQPGEKDPVRVLADEMHKRRFARQWDNFEKGNAEAIVGTPLSLLFPNEPSLILTLNGFNVFTVDQLASITDTAMQSIPMGRTLADRAKAYLSTAAGGANFHQMKSQIEELTAKLQALTEAGITAPTAGDAPRPRGPGRPPKVRTEGDAA